MAASYYLFLVPASAFLHASSDLALSWVLVDAVARPVSDFAALAPGRRPSAVCPHCGERVILKLGRVRRHHAAHRPGADCLATRPESALHLDCKFALGAALREAAGAGSLLVIRQICAGSARERCDRESRTEWLRDWNEVRVEHRLDNARRPDLLVLRDGTPIGAIEIVVSNQMAAEKAEALAAAGVPWIEVDADPGRRGPNDWNIGEPLEIRRLNETRPWRCGAHAGEIAFRARAPMQVREPPPDQCARSTILRAARVVDVYHPSGGRERFIYSIHEELTQAADPVYVLRRGTLEIARADADEALRPAFREDVNRLRRDDDVFADSPMQWAEGGAAEFIVHEAIFDRRPPDPTVLATTYPRRWFYSPNGRRWFLPDDMRDVCWDREPGDPFAPHPAARNAAISASARPAPEGSWSTLIFARRPSAAMFGRGHETTVMAPGLVRVDVAETRSGRRRALFVVERAMDDATIMAAVASARSDGTLWVSHPRDWRPALASVAWAAAGRDQRGRGAVLVDGDGVYKAEAFVRAIAAGESRVKSARVKRAMERRVSELTRRFGG
jgi:hypothetical protein